MPIKALVFLLAVILLEFYVVKRISSSLKNVFQISNLKKFKIIRRSLLWVINLYPIILIILLVIFLLGNNKEFYPPNNILLDWLTIYPFWLSLVVMLQTAVIILPIDLLFLIYGFIAVKKSSLNLVINKIILFIFLFFFIYVPTRIIYDYNSIQVSRQTFKKNDLPASMSGFKIALIADIQADYFTDEGRLEKYINRVQNEKPDLILIAGDMITSSPKYIELASRELGKLSAPKGVFACVGDHDNWAYRRNMKKSLSEVKASLLNNGIPMLDNQNLSIDVDSSKILLTAVTNTYVKRVTNEDLDDLTSDNDNYNLKIFFVHQPRERLIQKALQANYDLYLCGHTHGGQIVLLFPFKNIMMSRLEGPYITGPYLINKMMVYVNRGLGMSIAPVRYNATPEITIIELK